MQYTTFLVLSVIASATTATWLLLQQAILPMTLLSTALWGMLALQARSLTRYTRCCGSTTVAEPAFQYIALGMAVLSFGAMILWYFGDFPPDEPDEMDPEGEPITEGL